MSLFRKQALEQISSPEHLDEALVAAAPHHWVAFAAVFAIVVTALVWGVFGSVPTRIAATGILLEQESAVFSATAEGDGQIIEFLVEVGSEVERDQHIATLKQDVDVAELARIEHALVRAGARLVALIDERDADVARLEQLNARRLQVIEQRIVNNLDRERVLGARLEDMRALYEDGFTSRTALYEIENELTQVREEAAQLRYSGLEIEFETNRVLDDWRERVLILEKEIEAEQARQAKLQDLIRLHSSVDAPVAGVVTEISVSLGDVVAAGAPVMRIATHGLELDALLFVSPREGKRVQPGFVVNLEPSVVSKEEYGTVVAVVRQVSSLPLSPSGILAMLHNEKLVEEFSRDGPPIVIRAQLSRNPDSLSGLTWTGGSGPDFRIETGTLLAATITTREQAPISLVLPFLRAMSGL